MKEKKRSSAVLVHLRSYDSRLQESRVTLALVYSIRARSFLFCSISYFLFEEWNASRAEQSRALKLELCSGTEVIAVQVKLAKACTNFIGLYRPPALSKYLWKKEMFNRYT